MIHALPSEVIVQILGYLPLECIVNVARVNSQLLQIVKLFGAQPLDFTQLTQLDADDHQSWIDAIQQEIPTAARGARIRYLYIISSIPLLHRVFCFLQQWCPNVIQFDYDPKELADPLFNNTTYSIHTRGNHPRHPIYAGGWRHSIEHFPACYDEHPLRQHQPWSSRDPHLCKRLQTLYIRDAGNDSLWRPGKSEFGNLRLPCLPSLTTLTLHWSDLKFRENTIHQIHSRCPQLTTLTLRETRLSCAFHRKRYHQPPHDDPKVTGAIPTLKTLVLDKVHLLDHDTYRYFPLKYPNVQTLCLIFENTEEWMYEDHRRFRKCLFPMIAGFKHLTQLMIDVEGFRSPDEYYPDAFWFEQAYRAYLSDPSTKEHNALVVSYC